MYRYCSLTAEAKIEAECVIEKHLLLFGQKVGCGVIGSLMVVSPTARATFIRWVTEWYETHVTYRYAGDDMVGDLPEYTITELPEGYAENQEERIATKIQVSILYQSDTGYPITLHYIYLQEGAASQFVLDSTDDVVIDNVNGYEAYIFAATGQENDSNAITWIDP